MKRITRGTYHAVIGRNDNGTWWMGPVSTKNARPAFKNVLSVSATCREEAHNLIRRKLDAREKTA